MFKAGLISSTLHAVGLVIRLGFMLGLAHWTSPNMVGIYGLAVSTEAVVVYLAGMEFHTFTARRYALTGSSAKLRVLVSMHRRLLLVSAPLASAIGILVACLLSITSDWITLAMLAVLVAFGTVAQELGRYLNLTRQPIASGALSFLRTAAWQPVALPIVAMSNDLTYGLRTLLGLWTLSTGIGIMWAGYLLKDLWWPLASYRRRYLMRGLKESLAYYAIASLTVLQNNLERFVLQLLLGPSAVGVFSFFQMLANTLSALVQTASLNIALPDILTRFGQRNDDRFEYLKKLRKHILLICMVTGIAVSVATWPLTIALSKSEYISQLLLLPLLIIAQVLLLWTQPIHLALYAAKKDKMLLRLMVGALAASIFFDYFFIHWLGLSGAVIAPLLICLTVAIFRIRFMNQLKKSQQI